MDTLELIKSLTEQPGISGYESDFAESVRKSLEIYCPDAHITPMGSVIGTVGEFDSNKKTILFEAHLDRIGLVVSEVLDNGFLKFKTLGGVDERILPASEVCILGREKVFGVIGALPPHLMGKGEDGAETKIEDMMIDTGICDEKLKDLISVGDPIMLKSEFLELLNGRVSSAALDNRAGMASIFLCLEKVWKKQLPVNLKVAFTTGEELGLHGARTLLSEELPDLAVVVDVTHGATPDAEKTDTFSLGAGAVICRGPNLDYEITNSVIELAHKKEIPYDIEVAPGCTGTNAWALQTLGLGVRCALLSIPLRYMHTTVETLSIEDVEAVSSLLEEILLGGVLDA